MTAALTVDLREGFDGDSVQLSAAGVGTLQVDGVRTRMQTGLARSLKLEVAPDAARLQVAVRGLAADVALPAQRPLWVGVSIAESGDRLEVQVQSEPFGYL